MSTDELRERRIQRELDGLLADARQLTPERRKALEKAHMEDKNEAVVISVRTTKAFRNHLDDLLAVLIQTDEADGNFFPVEVSPSRMTRANVVRQALLLGVQEMWRKVEAATGHDWLNDGPPGRPVVHGDELVEVEQRPPNDDGEGLF